MINKLKKHKKLIILGTLITPIVLILLALVLINYLSTHLTANNPIININANIEVSSVDVLSLYLSILSILIGTYLTIGIFAFQIQEQEEKIKSVMDYYQVELLKSLNMIFHGEYANISIDLPHWIENSSQIRERVKEYDFELLNDLCVKVFNSKDSKENSFIKEYLNDFYIYFYKRIDKNKFEVNCFLNDKIVDALNSLGNKKLDFVGVKTNIDNKDFYKIEMINGEYIYFTEQNSINCNCSFKNGHPYSGYIQEVGIKYYKGMLHKGIKEGKGEIHKGKYILEEGEYVNGKLFNGKIYGKRIKEVKSGLIKSLLDLSTVTQLHDDFEEYDESDKEALTKKIKIADFNVINGEEKLIEGTVREIEVYDNIANFNKTIQGISKIANNLNQFL
ncbi:hypothetical protein QUV96_10350 [Amedibacillus dolichus]|uniref:Uncharacterized protein n=1 Tax=Amedibacillus dolichus TaxID=31971 RepID=A0ABT7UEH2_9FIRM|nr:hypothetical protein [Amedibacillus dolichus]MDM8158029.1 hypothetical protein [Amedibacillus dolichus]